MLYRIRERKDPRTPQAPGKYYGTIQCLDKINLTELASRISSTCTVTRADCLAVLSSLQEQIIYALQEGKRVHLGELGCFRISCNGLGSDTPETYNLNLLKRLKVIFTPNTVLKQALALNNKAISFNNLDAVKNAENATPGDETVE